MSDIPQFPTVSDVPFPYKTPYPQQEALMNTLLQSLKTIDEEGEKTEINPVEGKSQNTSRVMLLESPTGTGKSLSLACASLAWLKYKEKADIHFDTSVINSSHNIESKRNNTSRKKSTDWLDSYASDWADPRTIQEGKENEDRIKCKIKAKSARRALEQELQSIRSKIHDISISKTGNRSRLKIDITQKRKSARENLVRAAATAALMTERKKHRQKMKGKKKQKTIIKSGTTSSDKKQDFCVDDYHSDEKDELENECDDSSIDSEYSSNRKPVCKTTSLSSLIEGACLDGSKSISMDLSSDTITSMEPYKKINSSDGDYPTVGGVKPGSGVRKIIYAARTHSQLSQFVSEVRRTKWGKSIRIVALGSRKLLCGNKEVLGIKSNEGRGLSHKSEAKITEHCLDLQKGISSTKANTQDLNLNKRKRTSMNKSNVKGCPLLSSRDAVSALAVHMLAEPSDIEDLAQLGSASHSCSYYATRESLPAAEIVVLPYNTLLSKEARNAVGLSLKKSLVIIDEAHNIPEALRSIHSCCLTLSIVEAAMDQLSLYVKKYSSRLSARNLFYLGQLRRCTTSIIEYLKSKKKIDGSKHSILMSTTELLFELKLDNINLFKVDRYLERSRLPQKLIGFAAFLNQSNMSASNLAETTTNTKHSEHLSKHISPLSIVRNFLICLNMRSKDGKIVAEWPEHSNEEFKFESGYIPPFFRYVLLDPSSRFENVITESHAVALVGGTIRPFVHISSELLGSTIPNLLEKATEADENAGKVSSTPFSSITEYLTTFSCGHVVSPSNVFTMCVTSGPTSTKLDFRHNSRYSEKLCDELGRTLVNVCNVVPNGLVVFLPSYAYEAHLMRRWRKVGILEQIKRRKAIHREPKNSRDVDQTLTSYSLDATSEKTGGAIIFCVVGGKVSEGINFADDMARCVFVVGLPYADITDPELREKMQSLDRKRSNSTGISGQSYYHNLCMRAVNQSIGRAIRHSNDYAAIILADTRYVSDTRVWKSLPQWLRHGETQPKTASSFGKLLFQLKSFFNEMKQSGSS